MAIYCPCHLQLLFLNVSLVEISNETRVDFMPTTTIIKGTSLLLPGQIFTALMDLLAMMGGRAIGSEIKGNHNGLIHVANYAKLSIIPPLTVLSLRSLDMDNNLVRIWR